MEKPTGQERVKHDNKLKGSNDGIECFINIHSIIQMTEQQVDSNFILGTVMSIFGVDTTLSYLTNN